MQYDSQAHCELVRLWAENSWEAGPVPRQRLLAQLELLLQVGQQLAHGLVPHAALHHVGDVVSTLHDLYPRLVDVLEPLGFLHTGVKTHMLQHILYSMYMMLQALTTVQLSLSHLLYLRQLFGNISSHKDSFQIHP